MVVAAPADDAELVDLLATAMTYEGPFAIRYPRGRAPVEISARNAGPIAIGTGATLREGSDLALIGFGSVLPDCLDAADLLAVDGVDTAVINARFAKPLDERLILDVARRTGRVVTVEENVRAGGFGEAVLALLADHGLAGCFAGIISLPDEIVDHASQSQQRIALGLDAVGIVRTVRALIDDAAAGSKPLSAASR
jgi:1-deoxy-D-xylulose-5-phosphate synthase